MPLGTVLSGLLVAEARIQPICAHFLDSGEAQAILVRQHVRPGRSGVRRFVACLSGYSLGTLPDSMKASSADCWSRTYLPSLT